MTEYLLWALAGTVYGMLIGIVPVAGVTTALITVFTVGSYFMTDPYVGLVFLTAVVASCASADSYTSILTGIPGASTTAACVIDGYPMTKNGQAGRAMGIAIFDSTVNGVFYAVLAFMLLPYYSQVIMLFGIPEFAGFMIMSLACVGFVASKNVFKSVLAIGIGLYVGTIGQDPATGAARFTGGWDYIEAGIGMIPLLSGLFGIPELVWGIRERHAKPPVIIDYWRQLRQGFRDGLRYWRDTARGGLIGFVTGLLPGVGGAIGDFLAYGATKAAHQEPQQVEFGKGNPVGLVGCEGANNAQKVSSMIPTVLFGIPAAPFAAMVMAICMYFGIELGSPYLLEDREFVWSLAFGYIFGTIGVALLSIFLMRWIVKILEVPFWIYASLIVAVIVYANMQYTGGWEDLALLGICSVLGVALKYFDISRPAVLVTYVVAERLEGYLKQTALLYDFDTLITRPIFVTTIVIAVLIFASSIFRKDRGLNYT